MTSLGAEEPVQHSDKRNRDHRADDQRFIDVSQRNGIVVLQIGKRQVGHVRLNSQIDGVESKLRKNTGENGRYSELRVKNTCCKTRRTSREKCAEHSKIEILSSRHHGNQHGAACGKGAVHGKIGYIKNLEGEVNAYCHYSPDNALGNGSRHGV